MRIGVAVPDKYVTPEFIEAALETATRGNQAMLAAGASPLASELLASGAKWKPEPRYPDGEHFDLLPTIAGRGWGDCDDWAAGLAGELRHTGEDPGARGVIRRTGANRWHALVQTSDGEIHDPSRWAGMRAPSTFRLPLRNVKTPRGVSGAFLMPNGKGGWNARVDMPMDVGHVCGIATDVPYASDALARAALCVAPGHPDGNRILDTTEMIVGFDLGGMLGDVVKIAAPLAGTALGGPLGGMAGGALGQMLGGALGGGGGGGGGGAAPAAAAGGGAPGAPPTALPGGGPASMPLPGGGHIAYNPGGPIIVRF